MSWKKLPICVVDTETTGLDPLNDRVWELAMVTVEEGKITAQASETYFPDLLVLDPKITEITGMRIEQLRDKPLIKNRLKAIDEYFQKHNMLAAYNAPFDKPFVENEFARESQSIHMPIQQWLDPLVWVRNFQKFEKGKKLAEAATRCGIKVGNTHRALDDALLAAQILIHYLPKMPDGTAELLHLQGMWHRQQEQDRQKWRR